ncbi:hypothetical protein LSAT2_000907 [Lamellibrachia satsuma]|nr:hypothetical protein LSAT2_000907 [Lamellibrachia satsuma]
MRSLTFKGKKGNTLKRVNWEGNGKSASFHLDAWEADKYDGILAQGRRMWDNVPEMGSRFTLRAYLFAQSSVVTSLGALRVDKGDVKLEFEIDELQCEDCEDVNFVQVEAAVFGNGPVVVRDKKAFGKKLQLGGGASLWLPNKIFTDDDAKTKVDVETAEGWTNSIIFTVRLPLLSTRQTVYSILVKPTRPESATAVAPDAVTHRRQKDNGAQLTNTVGNSALVGSLCATTALLWWSRP